MADEVCFCVEPDQHGNFSSIFDMPFVVLFKYLKIGFALHFVVFPFEQNNNLGERNDTWKVEREVLVKQINQRNRRYCKKKELTNPFADP